MTRIDLPSDPAALDALIAELPDRPAVFLLWPEKGKPFLARTNILSQRLGRLLGDRDKLSRQVSLRGTAKRLEYQITGSRLEAQFLLWTLARQHLGPGYRTEIRLRLPFYVKLVLSNQFPRTQLAKRIGRVPAVYYGPFRSRASALRFESETLDLFQLRRCEEDLIPAPDHRGCIYGEMGRCLRPCQMAVGVAEYKTESGRVAAFLRSDGRSLLDSAAGGRERLSAEMDFEGAALMHQRVAKIEAVLAVRDELARSVENLNGIAVVPSAEKDAVELAWIRAGFWRGMTRFPLASTDGRPVSLDARLREIAASITGESEEPAIRTEQLALLARWYYSSWRDGELLLAEGWDKLPWRKIVNAIARVASGKPASGKAVTTPLPQSPSTHSPSTGSPPPPDPPRTAD
jgi:excinuclease UvrABC nuclease subunit